MKMLVHFWIMEMILVLWWALKTRHYSGNNAHYFDQAAIIITEYMIVLITSA